MQVEKISDPELKYYEKKLQFKNKISDMNVFQIIDTSILTDKYAKTMMVEHFINYAKAHFMKNNIFYSKAQYRRKIILKYFESNFKEIANYNRSIVAVGTLSALGGVAYKISKANAMKNITKDMNDHTHDIIWYTGYCMQCGSNTCTMCDSCIPHYKEETAT